MYYDLRIKKIQEFTLKFLVGFKFVSFAFDLNAKCRKITEKKLLNKKSLHPQDMKSCQKGTRAQTEGTDLTLPSA